MQLPVDGAGVDQLVQLPTYTVGVGQLPIDDVVQLLQLHLGQQVFLVQLEQMLKLTYGSC